MFVTILVSVLIASPFVFIIWHGLSNKLDRRWCTSKRNLKGKTAVITGASAGIGKETARDFARRGARVILACRDLKKAKKVADSIIKDTGNTKIVVYKLDTSDLQSVRSCAREIINKERRLDLLINNAGMGGNSTLVLTRDGFEETMATNYYGHFLLTNLLLGLLMRSGSTRIVNVSSQLHRFCFWLDPNNLNFEKSWFVSNISTYVQSKLCFNLFTLELARRLKEKQSGVIVNILHPGFVATEIFGKTKMLLSGFADIVASFAGNSPELGSQTTIHLAVSEEVDKISGKYFDNCQQCSPSGLSEDKELAKRLWEASVRDVGLKPTEMFL